MRGQQSGTAACRLPQLPLPLWGLVSTPACPCTCFSPTVGRAPVLTSSLTSEGGETARVEGEDGAHGWADVG